MAAWRPLPEVIKGGLHPLSGLMVPFNFQEWSLFRSLRASDHKGAQNNQQPGNANSYPGPEITLSRRQKDQAENNCASNHTEYDYKLYAHRHADALPARHPARPKALTRCGEQIKRESYSDCESDPIRPLRQAGAVSKNPVVESSGTGRFNPWWPKLNSRVAWFVQFANLRSK